jgi:hypothetical protein
MPFPKTFDQMKAAGYVFDNYAECRRCGDAIEWWITPNGKKMPMNPMPSGSTPAISHFTTCSDATEFVSLAIICGMIAGVWITVHCCADAVLHDGRHWWMKAIYRAEQRQAYKEFCGQLEDIKKLERMAE